MASGRRENFRLNKNRWNVPASSSPKEVIFLRDDTILLVFPPETTLSLKLRVLAISPSGELYPKRLDGRLWVGWPGG